MSARCRVGVPADFQIDAAAVRDPILQSASRPGIRQPEHDAHLPDREPGGMEYLEAIASTRSIDVL